MHMASRSTRKPQHRAGGLPRALRAVGRGWPVVCWALRCCRACRTAWRLQPMPVLRLRMHAVCCMQTSECASIQQCVASCTVECCCTPSSSVQQNPTVYIVQQCMSTTVQNTHTAPYTVQHCSALYSILHYCTILYSDTVHSSARSAQQCTADTRLHRC